MKRIFWIYLIIGLMKSPAYSGQETPDPTPDSTPYFMAFPTHNPNEVKKEPQKQVQKKKSGDDRESDAIKAKLKITPQKIEKLQKLYEKYSQKYEKEKSKDGQASQTTFIYWDRSKAAFNYSQFVMSDDFQQKLAKIERYWEKYRTKPDSDTRYKYFELHYAYGNLLLSVETLDQFIFDYGFERTCMEGDNLINGSSLMGKGIAPCWEEFKEVDSRLGDWLANQK